MIEFDVKCLKNYPLKCSLLDTEKEVSVRSPKYKGFLLYQFKDQADHVIPTVKDYFRSSDITILMLRSGLWKDLLRAGVTFR